LANQTQVATAHQVRINYSQPTIYGLLVSTDARHTGELGFDSLLRHFFKNLNQHLALPGPPGGQTVGPQFPAQVDNLFWWTNGASTTSQCPQNRWISVMLVHPTRLKCLVDNPEVEKATMNQNSNHDIKVCT